MITSGDRFLSLSLDFTCALTKLNNIFGPTAWSIIRSAETVMHCIAASSTGLFVLIVVDLIWRLASLLLRLMTLGLSREISMASSCSWVHAESHCGLGVAWLFFSFGVDCVMV
ncbi:hypothetical protein BO99DRAFT_27003 [Aspergillus violaceofuscus CBS 115571]|uniref:Uncharacterized protein n=1 Tax=Aspergillus violaceofuscus (strain CBS 115571) TaxID=1450538 RepID=A0A2V5HQR8_ASPV1|nr:hypothetical protein BO99DRAFT_27003 [Aspergillus violaceofuscus CBS 115571]